MRILLADDSRAMRSVFRGVLQKLGQKTSDILDAQDGKEARDLLARPDAPVGMVVFDWDLPGLSGPEFLQLLKGSGLAGRTLVLFCIGRPQRPLVAEAARVAPCDYIERPFTEEAFEAKIRGLGRGADPNPSSSRRLPAVAPPAAKPGQGGSSGRLPAVAPTPPRGAAKPATDVGLPFLVQLPSALIDDLLKLSISSLHDPGTVLLRAGTVCHSLNIVTRGEVEILEGAAGGPSRVVQQGDPYGELSFMTAQPSAETVRARSIVQTSSLSKAHLADLLRRHVELSKHLSGLVDRHKKVLHSRATTLAHSDFKGTFDTLPFADVMQMLMSTRKTGVLGLRSDVGKGAVYLESGEAIHAWTEDLKGEEAFYVLASWTKANFAFTSIRRQEPRTLHVPTITLLMKAMRHQEEVAAVPAKPAEDLGMDALFGPK